MKTLDERPFVPLVFQDAPRETGLTRGTSPLDSPTPLAGRPRMGRPRGDDSKERAAQFLCLIADGKDPVAARKEARIDPDRALVIACESTFRDVVRAIREEGGIVAAIVEPEDGKLAA